MTSSAQHSASASTSVRSKKRRFSTSSSISNRRHSRRISSLEQGENAATQEPEIARQEQIITEEIAEIKRYEDFTTIDWVQDAAREQLRRYARRHKDKQTSRNQKSTPKRHARVSRLVPIVEKLGGLREKLWQTYDAAQAWIVVTIVAVIIGVNAAVLNIITEWLSDIKTGYCSTSWYLNEDFCCYGAEDGCEEWKKWTSFTIANYIIYALFAVILSSVAAFLVKAYAPYAAGSGISEIKCIIAGFVMKGFLGFWTFLIKSICLPLAIASGLSVGKEGPSVHYAVCVGNVVSRFFEKYRRSASKTREILTVTAGVGVAVAFGSPIGGVLFSLEEMASTFPLKTLWRSFFCALVATAVLAAMNPFRTGQLVMFSVRYDRSWHFFEIVFYVILGIFGGLYGAFMIKYNLKVQAFRKKYLTQYAIPEAVILAGATALFCYPNRFLRVDMTEMMEILFKECEGELNNERICRKEDRWSTVASLFLATIMRAFFVIISYGCKVPAGIFVPSMAIGASFGRMVGILVEWLHDTFPQSSFFSTCHPDVPCITPGTYAFLGAGAALSGIMHITVSVTVIMFELTGALTYILPTMIVVGVTKVVGDQFSKAGIADRMIWFNGFPFLDNKEEHSFGVPVSQVMTSKLSLLSATGMDFKAVQKLLADTNYSGFPIVENLESRILIGYIGRIELQYAIDRIRKQTGIAVDAKCTFVSATSDDPTTPDASTTVISPITPSFHPSSYFASSTSSAASHLIDISPYIDSTPITVHPRLPLETAMELFKKMGPRVILVEHHGCIEGLVTVKDCLKYQFKVEHLEHQAALSNQEETQNGYINGSGRQAQTQSQLQNIAQSILDWAVDGINGLSRGRLKLTTLRLNFAPNGTADAGGWSRISDRDTTDVHRGHRRGFSSVSLNGPADDYRREREILDGTEELDDMDVDIVEMHARSQNR